MIIGSDAIERMSSMGACGLCALLLWLHCCWYGVLVFTKTSQSRRLLPRCNHTVMSHYAMHRCTPGSAAAAAAGSNFQRAALTFAMQVSGFEGKLFLVSPCTLFTKRSNARWSLSHPSNISQHIDELMSSPAFRCFCCSRLSVTLPYRVQDASRGSAAGRFGAGH